MGPDEPQQHEDSLQARMIRAARLDPSLYDDVAADERAQFQALAVVLLSSLATGIAFGQGDLAAIGQGMLFAVLGWYITAYLAFFIGTRLLPERSPETPTATGGAPAPPGRGPAGLLRAVGFASAPGMVRLLGVIPDLLASAMVITTLWMICATVIAIRQGLGFQSTARAAGVYAGIQLMLLPLLLILLSGQVEAPGTP